LKGGDGINKNGSLWILNEGCKLNGDILNEKESELFIPKLESATLRKKEGKEEFEEEGDSYIIDFTGNDFYECDLSFVITYKTKDKTEEVEGNIKLNDERNGEGRIKKAKIDSSEAEEEISVYLKFKGKNKEQQKSKEIKIKEKSEDTKGESGGDNSWAIAGFIVMTILFVLGIAFVVFVILISSMKIKKLEKNGNEEEEESGTVKEEKLDEDNDNDNENDNGDNSNKSKEERKNIEMETYEIKNEESVSLSDSSLNPETSAEMPKELKSSENEN